MNIIKALKDSPHLNLEEVANALGIDRETVSEAQRDHYKKFIKRDSPRWDMLGRKVNFKSL